MKDMMRNPIIPGFYPDPSICRVGDDFYLACSSFELWPGLPVFHSRDLVHWEQISNALTKENEYHTERGCGVGGLMAPTIRYNNGTYYIIDTNFADKGNFIITADDPKGPWSMPNWLSDVPGIDASIFFDEDGKSYVIGTGEVWDNGTGVKERGIWLAEYDMTEFKMIGEPVTIFNSALRVGASPESPHLYHIGDYYYLMIAEGGTEHYHSVMIARSRDLFGFYEGYPGNPVMSHRHMGFTYPICNAGHADLVQLKDGSWYAVMLASRLIDGYYKNLGRETFICPVTWERDWPVFSPGTGKIEWEYEAPKGLEQELYPAEVQRDEFDSNELGLHWTFWGTPGDDIYEIKDSHVALKCISNEPDEELRSFFPKTAPDPTRHVAYLARRQRNIVTKASCRMKFVPHGSEKAGMAVVQSMNHQLHVQRKEEDGRQRLQVILISADYDCPPYMPGFASATKREILADIDCNESDIVLSIEMNGQDWKIFYGTDEKEMKKIASADGRLINPEKVGCMCGTMIGMFATGAGVESENRAEFDWFELI